MVLAAIPIRFAADWVDILASKLAAENRLVHSREGGAFNSIYGSSEP